MKTFCLYAVAFDNDKVDPDALVFKNKEKAAEFAFDEVLNNNSANASIVRFDDYNVDTVATIDKKATVADYFNLTGKLPGGYIRRAA